MRHLELSKILALSLGLAVPVGGSLAQSTASHHVSVSIPVVLLLRIDDGHAAAESSVDVEVHAQTGITTIDPGTTRVAVRANTAWHLDAHFQAAVGSEALALIGRLDNGPWLDICHGARLIDGAVTHGWTVFDVAYGVAHILSAGDYWGTVVYTLTRP